MSRESNEYPDRPGFGHRGIRWLRHHLANFVVATPAIRQLRTEEERIDRARDILQWYLEEYRRYVVWTADKIYRGPGYCSWSVGVNWDTVRSDFAQALAETREWRGAPGSPAATAPVPPGPIDVDTALAALASAPDSAVAEPRAIDLLKVDGHWSPACNRLCLARERIRRKTPRPCHCCGTMFVGRAVSAITCDACKADGRKRCGSCGEVFSSTGRGPRKCERCRGVTSGTSGRSAAS